MAILVVEIMINQYKLCSFVSSFSDKQFYGLSTYTSQPGMNIHSWLWIVRTTAIKATEKCGKNVGKPFKE